MYLKLLNINTGTAPVQTYMYPTRKLIFQARHLDTVLESAGAMTSKGFVYGLARLTEPQERSILTV